MHVQGYLANLFHQLGARQGYLGREVALVGVGALRLVLRVLRVVISTTAGIGRHPDAVGRLPLLPDPQGALPTFDKLAILVLALRRLIDIVVTLAIVVLIEYVLALDLDVVDLWLEDLLAAHAILRLTRIVIVLLDRQVCPRAFRRLIFRFDAALLLIAQDRVVLLIRIER